MYRKPVGKRQQVANASCPIWLLLHCLLPDYIGSQVRLEGAVEERPQANKTTINVASFGRSTSRVDSPTGVCETNTPLLSLSLSIYIYIYMHVYIYIYICLSLSLSIYIHIYIYIWRSVSFSETPALPALHLYMCVCIYIYIYI